jgi:hypothetical protein
VAWIEQDHPDAEVSDLGPELTGEEFKGVFGCGIGAYQRHIEQRRT